MSRLVSPARCLALFSGATFLVSCGVAPRESASLRSPFSVKLEPVAAPGNVDVEEDEDAVERDDSAPEAARFDLLKRTGGGPVSMDRLFEARNRARRMPVYSIANRRFVGHSNARAEASVGLGSWQSLGPGNVGGRTRALAIRPDDPQTIYAGAVGGGVWKTTDGGASWKPLTDLLPSVAISTLAIDPGSPDTIYAGTGEWFTLIYGADAVGDSIRGAGIFKSTDGGATWTQLPGTTSNIFYYVNKIVVSPNDGSRLYAATWAGVYQSRNAGLTWTRSLDRSSPHSGCQDLVIRSDQSTDYLFASCSFVNDATSGIFRNIDAGGAGKWESVFPDTSSAMGRIGLALAPSNQSEIYAVAASAESGVHLDGLLGVYRSTSNGDAGSWQTQVTNQDPNKLNTLLLTNPAGFFFDVCFGGSSTVVSQGEYDLSIAVDPINPDVVWVGGIDVFRSDDGGKNWGIASFQETGAHADNHVIVFPPNYNGNEVQTVYVAGDGGVYRSDNALAATATGPLAGCSPYPTQVQWTNLNNGLAVTQFYYGAVFPGGGSYMGGTQDNGTQRGSDATGSQAWRRVRGNDGGDVAIDPTDPNIWYAESQNLNVVRTVNGGLSFLSATNGITEPVADFLFMAPFAMDPATPKRLYLGGLTLWRTEDGAQNWVAASAPIKSTSGPVSAIAISPTDSNHVVFGTQNGLVYRNSNAQTTDRNVSWDSAQPRTGFLSSLAFDPNDPNVVYATYSRYKSAASQSHVYKSTDGGGSWTGIDGTGDTGLPDVPVFSLMVDPQNTSTLYVGSDIGVFVSVDGGATWARDADPFADTPTEILRLDRTAGQNTLFAFTHGRGVFKTVLPGSGDPCAYSVSGGSDTLPAFGATATYQVSASDGCAWTAISVGPALVSSPAGGTGKGSFTVSALQNGTAQPRKVDVLVQDKLMSITQSGALVGSGNDDSGSPFSYGDLPAVVIQSTDTATESAADPVHSCTKSADSKTLWFTVTAPDAGSMILTVANQRHDTGGDSGTAITLYPVGNPTAAAELGCFVIPQTATSAHFLSLSAKVPAGLSFLIEISATTSGAASGAQILPGSLALTASLVK